MRQEPASPSVSSPTILRHAVLRVLTFGLVAGLPGLGMSALPAHAQDTPAFGDSGWVAPLPPGALDAAPTDPGPRVAESEDEPVGEALLRLPFRILFFPLRLIARGLEEAAGAIGPTVAPQNDFGLGGPPPDFKVVPTGSYSGGPGPAVGLNALMAFDRPNGGLANLGGTYSLWDTRRAFGGVRWGTARDAVGFSLRGTYKLRPNERFNGIGNFSSKSNRGIWLGETGRVDAVVRVGLPKAEARLLGGWRSTSARRGWNGEPGVLDVFPLAEVPGMLDATQTVSYGAGGDFAVVDDMINPTAGFHLRAEAQWFEGLGSSNFDYPRTHLEARAYLPVLSSKRVLAFRAVHQAIEPDEGEVVPFYLLPDVTGDVHLAGYSAHRFIDNHLALARAEYRWLVWEDKLWAVAIAEIAEVASSAGRLRIADVHESYGGGLRLGFQSTVMRATVARGSDGLITWFSLEEDF
jgi:hypothetical protein